MMSKTTGRAQGWSLVELLVVIGILGILIAFFVPPVISRITTNARATSTRQEMRVLREAVMGNPDIVVGGEMVAAGFRNDVGRFPFTLNELAFQDTIRDWDPYNRRGWNGPYIRDDGNLGFTRDAWDQPYVYWIDGFDTVGLLSTGGPDTLRERF